MIFIAYSSKEYADNIIALPASGAAQPLEVTDENCSAMAAKTTIPQKRIIPSNNHHPKLLGTPLSRSQIHNNARTHK
jgi:hypothetical protein